MNMTMNSKALSGLGLVALLAGGCGDDDSAGTAGDGSNSASGASDTDTDSAGDASGGGTTRGGDASGSATSTSGEDSTSAASNGDASATDADTDSDSDSDSASASASDTDGGDTGTDGSTSQGSDDSADSQGETAEEVCEAPGAVMPCDDDSDDPFHAIGLNCPYGADEAIPIFNESITSPDAAAWRVARQLGTYVDANDEPLWRATEGEQFLMISSSRLATPDQDGVLIHADPLSIGNSNPNGQQLPAPMSPSYGSNNGLGGTPFVNCDLANDCSDSLQEQWQNGGNSGNDLMWFQFSVDVPGGTHGFSFDFAYFSVEFTSYIGTVFNDMFVVWSNSETYTGNLCFVDDQPCTVTALGVSPNNPQQQYTETSQELVNTGFYGWGGGGTGWFEAKGSAAPGETLQLTWAIFDMGDSILDTAVIIDNFQWDCEGCTPSEVDPCGIRPLPQ